MTDADPTEPLDRPRRAGKNAEPEPDHEVDEDPDLPWYRLDPRTMLAALVYAVVRLTPAALAWLLVDQTSGVGRYLVLVLILLGVMRPASKALSYVAVRYRLTDSELQVRRGLLVRKSERIALHRIRTVDITAPLTNRLFRLAVVRVGTGGNALVGSGTVVLDGLPRGRARRLRDHLVRAAGPDVVATGGDEAGAPVPDDGGRSPSDPPTAEVQRVQWPWIIYSMVGAWLITGPLSVVGSVYGFVSMFGQEDWVGDTLGDLIDRVPWPAWAATTLVLAVLLGIGAGALAFIEAWWGFRLVREPGATFVATRGLLTTRSFTADQARLRGLTLSEPFLTRLLGGARMTPVMTGISLQQQMNESATVLPATTREVAVRVGNTMLGRRVLDERARPAGGRLVSHPPAARRRAIIRYAGGYGLVGAASAAAVLWREWPGWLLAGSVALLCLGIVAGLGYYRTLGHLLGGEVLYLRRGFFSRRTDAIEVRGINGAHVRQGPIQRLLGLATLVVTTAAGEQGYRGVDLALHDATVIAAEVTREPVAVPA
ncbi:PH domain-containing protein [Georgenia deserti]|uniref:PH domain-containing protein n=1 Tax=Georgenia deserti TaxID=2093781 RepID=A0ABW4L975_9MICO